MQALDPSAIRQAAASVPQWQQNGAAISRTFQFKGFLEAIKFVNSVAELAEKANHHPDIDIRWNKVSLTLSTHDVKGLTQKDFDLAKELDRL